MYELKELESTKQYVFHGSSDGNIKILEPRQAMSWGKPDGMPAVCAAAAIEPAIFMAVLGSKHVGGWGKGKIERGQFGFYLKKSDYQKAKQGQWRGYVYILSREDFEHYVAWEWRASRAVKPVKIIQVGINDLPAAIEIEP
jgi:hypothetical protein